MKQQEPHAKSAPPTQLEVAIQAAQKTDLAALEKDIKKAPIVKVRKDWRTLPAGEREKELKAQWAQVRVKYQELVKLGEQAQGYFEVSIKTYLQLHQCATELYHMIPDRDSTLLQDSPLSPNALMVHLRQNIAKFGEPLFNWVATLPNGPSKVPSIDKLMHDAKNWIFRKESLNG